MQLTAYQHEIAVWNMQFNIGRNPDLIPWSEKIKKYGKRKISIRNISCHPIISWGDVSSISLWRNIFLTNNIILIGKNLRTAQFNIVRTDVRWSGVVRGLTIFRWFWFFLSRLYQKYCSRYQIFYKFWSGCGSVLKLHFGPGPQTAPIWSYSLVLLPDQFKDFFVNSACDVFICVWSYDLNNCFVLLVTFF